jgi:hypothetical protein
MINQDRSYITYSKLDEQCRRVLEVFERHSDKSAAIASNKTMLQPIVNSYLEQQEQLTCLKASSKQALIESAGACKQLYQHMRSWFGQLSMAISGFEPGDFSCKGSTPDNVIGAVDRLIGFIRSRQDETESGVAAEGEAISSGENNARIEFAAQLIDDLGSCRTAAYEKWRTSQDLLAEEQELRDSIRKSAIEVQRALVAVRETLRNTLGINHRDYQRLRVSRGQRIDDETAETTNSVDHPQDAASTDASRISQQQPVASIASIETSVSTTEDKGNGKGKAPGVAPYFIPIAQANPPAQT